MKTEKELIKKYSHLNPVCKNCTDYRHGGCDECSVLNQIVEDNPKYIKKENVEAYVDELIKSKLMDNDEFVCLGNDNVCDKDCNNCPCNHPVGEFL